MIVQIGRLVMASKLRPSPTAQAFFDALDGGEAEGRNQSTFVKKRIQTLGWRNRHSQDDLYPVQIGTNNFSVLQVQRGEIEGTYGTGKCNFFTDINSEPCSDSFACPAAPSTIGATVWPASMVLMKYLERHPTLVRDKRVVDLGAGTGVTSIAATLLGADHCYCTDGEESVVRLSQDNMDRQTLDIVKGRITTQVYWWGSDTIAEVVGNPCDVVLVSDCVLPKLYPIAPLVEALDQLLVRPDAVAILSYEHRYFPEYDPKDKFCELCGAKQLAVRVVPLSEQDPVYSVEDIEIWIVSRQAANE